MDSHTDLIMDHTVIITAEVVPHHHQKVPPTMRPLLHLMTRKMILLPPRRVSHLERHGKDHQKAVAAEVDPKENMDMDMDTGMDLAEENVEATDSEVVEDLVEDLVAHLGLAVDSHSADVDSAVLEASAISSMAILARLETRTSSLKPMSLTLKLPSLYTFLSLAPRRKTSVSPGILRRAS